MRQLLNSSHVFFISAGFWSQMERGESWLDPPPITQVLYAHRHTHTHANERERRTYFAHYPHPPTTSTDYKLIQSRGLYFPRVCCQFGLITLSRFALWQYNMTLRFKGMHDCLSKSWIYTYLSLQLSKRSICKQFLFSRSNLLHFQSVSGLGAASRLLVTQQSLMPCSRANSETNKMVESITHSILYLLGCQKDWKKHPATDENEFLDHGCFKCHFYQ